MAGGRALLGLAMTVAPEPFATGWIGRQGRRSGAQLLTRTTGGRDAALGAAAVLALARGRDARALVAAQVVADATDLVGTLRIRDDLPPLGSRGVAALAGSATVMGLGVLAAMGGAEGSQAPAGGAA